ncbi:MAG TPA: hypothetical protein VGN23_06180 [Verrucomicrobiae bacterium]|jgi:hypothetical protein
MKKFLIFIFLIFLAMVLSGLYGMVHDQISYTVSPEYFTKFKFRQFGLDGLNVPDRAKAAIVGFLASWWMGIPIGLMVGGCGFMHSGHWRMLKISLWSYAGVIAFTFLFGLCGLCYGWGRTQTINLADYQNWYIPDGVVHLRRFLCVGYMHNSSYIGGAIAIFVAAIFHLVVRIKAKGQDS